jgi:hypothetical protein
MVWGAELGLELRDYTLSQSTSTFYVIGVFKIGSYKLFAQLSANHDLSYLFLLGHKDCSCEPLVLSKFLFH